MNKIWSIKDFPVGLYNLHSDPSVNFQMNRFFNWSNDHSMLQEMQNVSSSIHSYGDLTAIFIRLGEEALGKDEKLKAALYFRGAEFFIPEEGPNKQKLRNQFISLSNAYYGVTKDQHYLIPYEDGYLSAYRFTPKTPKGVVVICNGFDGYIEEITRILMIFRDAGYDTIVFDGPGQGTILEEYHMPMTHEWEKPVKILFDYFKLNDVTLIGMSLGGYLALRAAAYENRIKRVIAYDILPDFFEVIMNQLPSAVQENFKNMISQGKGEEEINIAATQMMQKSLMLEWGLTQGMHVTGCDSPYEFFRKTMLYNALSFSSLISQDVLLLAGQEDHYVPIKQLPEQIMTLTNVHSITARIFTAKEIASNHCQLGNIGLAVNVMLNWIDQIERYG
jgi:pimeloyl-ACP methyl ester carboxylesterase